MASRSPTSTGFDYDLVVIGAGPVGENVADYATQHGLRTAIIEHELVGGECSYWACMPSKALLRSGSALRAAQRVAGAHEGSSTRLDAKAVLRRRTSFTSNWHDDGQVDWLGSAGIDLIRGRGQLAGRGLVQVGDDIYSARAVAIATGSVPVLPQVPGLATAEPWGTREATSTEHIPARLIIIGGGVAGSELALAFTDLGSQVTLAARSTLLGNEEPFVSDSLAQGLTDAGVDVRLNTSPERVDRAADRSVTVVLDDGDTVIADEILVATGRRPNTDNLGFESVGVDSKLMVDDTMLVKGTDWLYAVGDVNGRALLTHQGKYQARIAGQAIATRLKGSSLDDTRWGRHVATADHHAVPHVVFTDPEVASVGLTERQASELGLEVRGVEYDLGAVAGAALHADDYTGRAKIVVDQSRGVVVGATFVGQDVAELLHAVTVAIIGEVSIDRLRHAVPSYPTISEVWLRLLEEYDRPA